MVNVAPEFTCIELPFVMVNEFADLLCATTTSVVPAQKVKSGTQLHDQPLPVYQFVVVPFELGAAKTALENKAKNEITIHFFKPFNNMAVRIILNPLFFRC